jgi:hypothetical protein
MWQCPEKSQARIGRFSTFLREREKNAINVISITALGIKMADHSQGESGVGRNRAAKAKSVRLKILPLSS